MEGKAYTPESASKIYNAFYKVYIFLMSIAFLMLLSLMVIHFIRHQTLIAPSFCVSQFISLMFLYIYARGAYDIFFYFKKMIKNKMCG